MDVKLFVTSFGQIVAEVLEITDGGYRVKNPVSINPAPGGQLSLFPILAFSEEKEAWLKRSDLNFSGGIGGGAALEPALEIKNHYSAQFGSGIQIVQGAVR